MKAYVFRLSLLVMVSAVFGEIARADDPAGIKFFTGSWKDVLTEARRQNKPVFIDIYTTWCGPCKMMAKQAFPDAKVGEKFNANFINYQIDAEKGEGITVAKQYAVAAYPTSLYVSADGDLIHRAIGYGGIKGLLDEADKAIEVANDPNPLSAMEKQYQNGQRETAFLAAYLQKRANVGIPNGEALEAYLKTTPEAEWKLDKNVALIAGNATTYNPKVFDLLLQKLIQTKDDKGEQALIARNKLGESVFRLNQAQFQEAIATKNEQTLTDVIKTNEAYLTAARGKALSSDQADEMATDYRMRFYQQTKNADKYGALAKAQADKLMNLKPVDIDRLNAAAYERFEDETRSLPDSIKQSANFKQYAASMKKLEPKQTAMKLNNLAWAYYENVNDKSRLNQALTWSAKSLEYDRIGMYLDTYAHLLNKQGRKAEAIKIQEEAIAKQKAAGEDASGYEKELASIKSK